ncbi:MAG TPA: GrpB family protein [Polyangiaceae bacterium]
MSEAPIHLVPYDPTWVAKFEDEKALLETLLAPWRRGPIEHVGSTAVPGLCAKPVIDVMVGVTSLAESAPTKSALREAGYQYAEYKTEVMHWFCKPSFAMRTHHLHLIPYGSPLWHDRLRFRDLLRTDSTLAGHYAALKIELAREFEFDREAYTDGKSPFIARTLASAG